MTQQHDVSSDVILKLLMKFFSAPKFVFQKIEKHIMFFFRTELRDVQECFVNCRLSQDSVSMAHMLTATNTFARRIATDCRRQLCRFGENLTNNLLHVWNNRPSDSLKVLMKITKSVKTS